jgi:hypothetical protein
MEYGAWERTDEREEGDGNHQAARFSSTAPQLGLPASKAHSMGRVTPSFHELKADGKRWSLTLRLGGDSRVPLTCPVRCCGSWSACMALCLCSSYYGLGTYLPYLPCLGR